MSNTSDISFYRISSATVVRDDEIKRFEEDIFGLIRAKPNIRLAIDFTQTYHVSSRALGLLVAFRRESQKTGGRIVLFGINPAIEKVMQVTRLSSLIPLADSEARAVTLLREAPTS